MSGMDSSSSSGHDMDMMAVFKNSMTTSLYSASWTPSTTGQYAGTCIFLIVLGVVFRCILAFKGWQERRWLEAEFNRRYVVVNGKPPLAENISRDSMSKKLVLSENGVEENVMVIQKRTATIRPWRLSIDPIRAVLDTIIAGVSYLLYVLLFSSLALRPPSSAGRVSSANSMVIACWQS